MCVRTDGGDESGVKGVIAEAEEYAGFPNARVPDEQQLEQQVVRLLCHDYCTRHSAN